MVELAGSATYDRKGRRMSQIKPRRGRGGDDEGGDGGDGKFKLDDNLGGHASLVPVDGFSFFRSLTPNTVESKGVNGNTRHGANGNNGGGGGGGGGGGDVANQARAAVAMTGSSNGGGGGAAAEGSPKRVHRSQTGRTKGSCLRLKWRAAGAAALGAGGVINALSGFTRGASLQSRSAQVRALLANKMANSLEKQYGGGGGQSYHKSLQASTDNVRGSGWNWRWCNDSDLLLVQVLYTVQYALCTIHYPLSTIHSYTRTPYTHHFNIVTCLLLHVQPVVIAQRRFYLTIEADVYDPFPKVLSHTIYRTLCTMHLYSTHHICMTRSPRNV
jgi:hypothetical protein